MEADERYMREQHVSPDDDWNYVHNMMYAIANLMEQGKLSAGQRALRSSGRCARPAHRHALYLECARSDGAPQPRLPVALRVADWDAVLTLLGQANLGEGEKTTNLRFLAAELSDYAAGMKALDANDVAAAEAASARMDAGLWRAERDQAAKSDNAADDKKADTRPRPPSRRTRRIAHRAHRCRMPSPARWSSASAWRRWSCGRRGRCAGQARRGQEALRFGGREEKKPGYHEPPFYIRPVGENEAAALIKAKDYAGAKIAYEAALAERPTPASRSTGWPALKSSPATQPAPAKPTGHSSLPGPPPTPSCPKSFTPAS